MTTQLLDYVFRVEAERRRKLFQSNQSIEHDLAMRLIKINLDRMSRRREIDTMQVSFRRRYNTLLPRQRHVAALQACDAVHSEDLCLPLLQATRSTVSASRASSMTSLPPLSRGQSGVGSRASLSHVTAQADSVSRASLADVTRRAQTVAQASQRFVSLKDRRRAVTTAAAVTSLPAECGEAPPRRFRRAVRRVLLQLRRGTLEALLEEGAVTSLTEAERRDLRVLTQCRYLRIPAALLADYGSQTSETDQDDA